MASPKVNKHRVSSYIGAGVVAGIGYPVNTVAPAITGTAKVGQTLTATDGTWTGSTSITRQWRANGIAIPGATATTYVPVTGNIGKTITVVVSAKNSQGTTPKTSAATVAVVA